MQELVITKITPPELQELIRSSIDQALQAARPKQTEIPDERFTRKEICAHYKISFPTLHKAMREGLPFEKIGRKTIFRRQEVDQFFQSKRLNHEHA